MGQTLSHGVYLPAEGERNCYSGLASNWNLLDTAIGDTAGKASATHSHGNITNDGKVGTSANKPLITGTGGAVQAGSFGTSANTFCEGNDSRLSDARTPVAHTHTKSDVTDLFNSANTWTGDNTYTKYLNAVINGCEIGVAPLNNNKNGILFKDKNGVNIGWLRHSYDSNGELAIEMLVSNKYKNGALDPTGTQVYQGVKQVLTSNSVSYFNWSGYVNNSLYPYTTETFNIGDSTHQWNNLYAKNYYYNGVAWGLDKANEWSQTNYFSSSMYQKVFTARASIPSSNEFGTFIISDFNAASVMSLNYANRTTGVRDLSLRVYDQSGNANGVMVNKDASNNYSFCSINPNNTIELGTSTNKWKTLNGINPGALSLPSATSQSIDTTEWVTNSWSPNYCDAPFDGYISIACFANSLQINNETKSYGMTFQPGDDGFVIGLMPVCSGDHIKVAFVKTQTSLYEGYKFIKANGNVS